MEQKKQRHVCLIDDDEDLREIYSMALQAEGYGVVLASNGDEGLKLVRQYRPDLILLDLQMPVKSGIEVLKELNVDEKIAGIPVIVLSNIDSEESFRQIGRFDTRFYLVKSLTTPKKVVGCVREVLGE